LRQEKEHSQHVEQLRKGPELQIKEMQVRLDEAESSPIKNRKKITKLKERIQLLEQELDGEQVRKLSNFQKVFLFSDVTKKLIRTTGKQSAV